MNTAFPEDERKRIPVVEISNPDNDEYETPGGNNTRDQVFLLSIDEANNYYSEDEDRICMPTEYALAKDEDIMYSKIGAGCWWWLRSPGNGSDFAAGVDPSGFLDGLGNVVADGYVGVRPALWVNL